MVSCSQQSKIATDLRINIQAQQSEEISCICYDENTAEKFYQSVNEYLDKQDGINGAVISSLAFQLFAYSKLNKDKDENKNDQQQAESTKNNRYLILRKSNDKQLSKETIIAAIVQLETVIFLSSFTNIDLNNEATLKQCIQILTKNINPIESAKGLEICGKNKQIIDLLIAELKFDKLEYKEMEQNVYLCTNTKKYDEFCKERIEKCKLKIDNVTDKNREELFGHLIEGDPENEEQIKLIKEWYPKFCDDTGLKFNEKAQDAMIRNMKSKKVYFWGREHAKDDSMIDDKDKDKKNVDEKKENKVGYDLVSLAAFTGYTPHMARIGYVYTPTDERRKGYATHLVGVLSQIMEKENKMVWIIADKKNIASNKAYTRIGFNLESSSFLMIFS